MVKVKVRDVQLFESYTIISYYPEKMGQRDILLIGGFWTQPMEPVDPVKGWFR